MSETNAVIDLSHHNGSLDFRAIAGGGILGVVHKATQATGWVDNTYHERRAQALAAGLWWGAYHFAVAGDGRAQARHFLEAVQPDAATLCVLDFEDNPQGPDMSIEQARDFVLHLKEATGRWPVFYSGFYWILERLGTKKDQVLANCPFWLAGYTKTPQVPASWPYWTLWQYTNGKDGLGPKLTPGAGRVDRNKFRGDVSALRQFWTGISGG